MLINIILFIIFIFSLGGIIFIIKPKLPLISNLDLSKVPQEKIAQVKKDLLDKKIDRQIIEVVHRLRIKRDNFKINTKNIFLRLKDLSSNVAFKTLAFFRKKK